MTRSALLVSFVALACRLDGDDERTGALASAWCDVQTRCANECGTVATSHDLCVRQYESQFAASAAAGDTFDLAFSQMCFDRVVTALDELSCDEAESAWAWAERSCAVWHGHAELGDECRPFDLPENYAFVSACRPGLVCALDAAAGSDTYRCRDVTDDPGEGEGCLRYQGSSVVEERCADGLRCDLGVCVSGPEAGDTCDCGGLFGCEVCVDGWCDADVGETAGTCQPFTAVGEPCGATVQPQCEYICDPGTSECIAPDEPTPLACALMLQL
ncbi:MAG TPA: hypothetical protein VFG69_14030 [Nannocystaceae bacterium]|nr:hypothetical protein [Nannocystaceae bacterium]